MKRRLLLSGAAQGLAVAAVGASSLASPALAQGIRQLNMVTTWPRDFPGMGTGARRLAESITRMSGGKLTVEVFAAGERVPPTFTTPSSTIGRTVPGLLIFSPPCPSA